MLVVEQVALQRQMQPQQLWVVVAQAAAEQVLMEPQTHQQVELVIQALLLLLLELSVMAVVEALLVQQVQEITLPLQVERVYLAAAVVVLSTAALVETQLVVQVDKDLLVEAEVLLSYLTHPQQEL